MIQKLQVTCLHCSELNTIIADENGDLFVPFNRPEAPRKKRAYKRRKTVVANRVVKSGKIAARKKAEACANRCGRSFTWKPARLAHERFCKE